jgi:Ran GTPase-activating protein (RanGAP) involved in mRNA processing and transport
LAHLKGLRNLDFLVLIETKITDEGLIHLARATELEVLSLSDTKVTNAGVKSLQEALPDCKISK